MIRYDPHIWRSTFFAIRGSMIQVIGLRSFYVTLVATVLTVIHFYVVRISLTSINSVHGIVSTAMGFLLVFRTNASYDRWWEGRKLWGAIVNTCRNMARSAVVHLSDTPERLEAVMRLIRAFPPASTHLLRNKQWNQPELFSSHDSNRHLAKSHPPLAICTSLSEHLKQAHRARQISDIVFTSLDADCHQLVDIIGACERIHKTPIPFAYVVHLRRALVIYCASLPLALVDTFGWYNLIIVFVISYILFGIEEIGVEIEDPFGDDENDLPLEQISEGIDKNVRAFEEKR
jgi:putative membrane protein